MKVTNMTSARGNKIANQFIIEEAHIVLPDDNYTGELFQSYDSNIAMIATGCGNTGNCHTVLIDSQYWDYSVTTGRYRNQFLGENKKETQSKIDSGEYRLVDLN